MVKPDQADSLANRQRTSPHASHPGREGEASAGDRLGERAKKTPAAEVEKGRPHDPAPTPGKAEERPESKDLPPLDNKGLDF